MKSFRTLRPWLAVMAGIFAISIMSCSGGGSSDPTSGTTDSDWVTGDAETFEFTNNTADISTIVEGATVTAETGTVGALEIAPITSGPALSFDATKIAVSYTGTDELQITIPRDVGEETILFAYGSLENAAVDGRNGFDGWWSIPIADESDSTATFDLPIATPVATKATGTGATPPTRRFAIATLPAGSTEATKLAAIRTTVREVVDYWLDNLPAAIATTARTEINGDLAYTISWSSDGNAYQHGDNWISSNAVFYLTKDVQLDIIAHEVGHYMTHVLCGYDRYEEIYQRFPTDFWGAGVEHGIGDYREGRLDLLEDYAYFSTYMITGALQATDLKKAPMWTLFKNHNPSEYDYPSHEAYGATMLATLLRSEKEVYTFNKNHPTDPAPVVNAPLADVLGIMARGPRDVNELREFISEYLTDRGTDYQYMLPAIMEPLGWSYNGMGNVKYDDDSVVDDATVRSICQTGEDEYHGTISTTTGANGKYLLTRIYPGSNLLRVYYNDNKDSTDVPFTVQWDHETHKTLTIPDIVIPKDELKPTDLSGTFSSAQNAVLKDGEPYITITGEGTWSIKGVGVELSPYNYDDRSLDFVCKPGAKGTLTITGAATLSGNTFVSTFFNDRMEHTLHSPVMLPPIEDQNYLYDEGVTQTATGGGGTITINFEFPLNAYWQTFQIGPQFEVLYDWTAYDDENEVIDSATDVWWMNYTFQHYYFHVDSSW